MGTSGSFKIVRPLDSYLFHRRETGNGQKCIFFRIFAHSSNAKFFKRYPGMPYESWRPAGSENVVFFVCYNFVNHIYGCSKFNGVWNFEFVIKIMRRPKIKYARAQQNSNKSSCKKFLNPILKLLSGGFVLKFFLNAHIFIFWTTPIFPQKGYLSNFATGFQKFHFFQNRSKSMVSKFHEYKIL